ncbi:MAG: S9 family peptidase [Saprospiraceae bacterium]|nr:S9 family peptidase [Saprospiraceae bacterium]
MVNKRFDENTKGSSYVHLYADSLKTKLLTGGDDVMLTTQVKKPRKNSKYLFTSENFNTFPDLLLANADFSDIKKITNANPQQAEYGWGKAQLMAWTNYDNQKNEGMVFYPPQFDPEKKYPLIVNFYERSSDELHRHRAPEAHRSSINYTYYTNLGYIIFNPDIKYKTGQPGDDCYNAVESGVDALVKTGYIDETRIALQGHSWGGYQVAYLLTKSERYRCAESGAPVVNMVSAYGGIRWESGMSRMFQYEKTQSRLGATLWENPERFHHNSPIYNMPKVTTPVLILHNDEDGAVPWYQGIEYFMALRRLGKPAWLLNYNSEPHWPVKWQNRLDFNIRMEQFFNHYLMDGPLPLWMKEGNNPVEKGILKKY